MSGYGGYPSGWQDPRGPQGWSGSPYPGGPQPPGYGYGPPPGPVRPTSNASTTACLVCNIASVLLCCGILGIPGAIVAAIAMSRVQTEPESARKLTIAAWVLFALSIISGIVIFIVFVIARLNSASSYDSPAGV